MFPTSDKNLVNSKLTRVLNNIYATLIKQSVEKINKKHFIKNGMDGFYFSYDQEKPK